MKANWSIGVMESWSNEVNYFLTIAPSFLHSITPSFS
jgi:hypothetical protein